MPGPKSNLIDLEILDGMPDGIALVRVDGSIIHMNAALRHMCGVPDEPGEPLKLESLAVPDNIAQWRRFFTHAAEDGGPMSFDATISRASDKFTFYAEVSFHRKSLHGEPVIVATIRNMSRHRKIEEALRLEESRLEALLRLNQMTGEPINRICDFALEEAVRLTGSRIGYLAFYDEEQEKLTMHAWSAQGVKECRISNRTIEYPIKNTGLWGEAVRQRRPVITNDYNAPSPYKKGLPPGHVRLERHMNVPIMDDGRIVVVAGVGNKPEPYDIRDVRELVLLMEGMWRLLQRKQSEDQLKMSLAEKEVLLKEIHHRVKNNLQIVSSLISLQSEVATPENMTAAFKESQDRIRSMAMIHERLYRARDLAKVDFGEYLRNLTSYLKSSYQPRTAEVQIDVQNIMLDIDRAIPCGLIVNELVSNAFKYAFPDGRRGTLEISMRKDENGILLVVADDGPGLPPGIDVSNTPTLGLQLVHALVGQLDGELALHREKGARFEIRFK
ncbi:sensor histidine kinase [Methanocella arvoryzae]|uniref:Predicted signal transduction histidine kinase n=1 Tax=Methanocella arvoryzae (strain DSM 22066 / NBRC 105507 / MRE50) TaxID=351160 RepID=Q0W4W0_METAR|nr:histidine kinase dimerization/phosphoacceptor domain -containing protein [Methanocella arvoryzae]CAJ36583.1 predicted signal transduction histidine kinase [Methanocella arvoryzae MRE50]